MDFCIPKYCSFSHEQSHQAKNHTSEECESGESLFEGIFILCKVGILRYLDIPGDTTTSKRTNSKVKLRLG